jgi:hypothetical protein
MMTIAASLGQILPPNVTPAAWPRSAKIQSSIEASLLLTSSHLPKRNSEMVSEVSQEISRSFLILSQSHHWFLMVFASPSIGKKRKNS